MSTWNQALCQSCFWVRQPDAEPVRSHYPEREICSDCGIPTRSGIYMRLNPTHVRFPRQDPDDPCPHTWVRTAAGVWCRDCERDATSCPPGPVVYA
jgi:hypothetical protein